MPKIPREDSSEAQPEPTTIEHLLTDDPLRLLQALDGRVDATLPQAQAAVALLSTLPAIAPRIQNGLELYAQLRDHVRIIPSGCDPLDTLLRGGLREGLVTEICGESSSGKTQICLLAALATAHRNERVLYFDTTNSFSPARLSELHTHACAAADAAAPPDIPLPPLPTLATTLGNITVVRPHSYHHLARQLDDLALQISQLPDASSRPPLVVIDSVSALLSPVVGSRQHNQGQALMTCLGRSLKSLADSFRVAVLVTNHVASTGQRDGGTRPALGEQWRGQPHVRVSLALAPEVGVGGRCLRLISCTFSDVGQKAWFQLGAGGAASLAL